jgi:SAM-dependent methyltransferase
MAYRDTFGKALMAHYLDNTVNDYLVERDDGLSEPLPTDNYFIDSSRFSDGLKAALEHVSGRVLDIGCGAGRISLHLQDRFHVVGMDISHLALKVCQLRGVKHLVNARAPFFPFGRNAFDTAILMGNNYGLCGSVDATREMMKNLHRIMSDDGIIIAQSRDPYDTEKEIHLRYHQRNIENGRPAGQVTIRVGFNGEYSDWFDLLMQSSEEMAETIHPYWQIDRTYDSNIAILRLDFGISSSCSK